MKAEYTLHVKAIIDPRETNVSMVGFKIFFKAALCIGHARMKTTRSEKNNINQVLIGAFG
jgi:hypothetical protein